MAGPTDKVGVYLSVGVYIFLYLVALFLLPNLLIWLGGYFFGGILSQFAAAIWANWLALRIYSRMRLVDLGLHWNRASARNLALGELRHRGVVRRAQQHLAEEAAAGGDEWTVERYEAGEQVRAALACLPEDQRTAVILKEYQQLEYRDIAQVLGCSEAAARARTYRARTALRALLREWWEAR